MAEMYFYEGTSYDNEVDFLLAVKRFEQTRLSWLTAQRAIDHLTRDMLMNVFMGNEENCGLPLINMTNFQFKNLLSQTLIKFVNDFRREEAKLSDVAHN